MNEYKQSKKRKTTQKIKKMGNTTRPKNLGYSAAQEG